MKVAVKDLRPNPFRHYERYPLQPAKLEALKESLRRTGFWDNVVARPVSGGAEIAYGHHRLAALKEVYGPEHVVEVIARDLDDATMLQIMARENMEEWGTSFWVEMETVAAVIRAYDEGKIDLEQPASVSGGGHVRVSAGGHSYTSQTVGHFLGWVERSGRAQDKVDRALAALDFIAEGLLSESDFAGLSTMQAAAMIQETRRTKERHEQEARRAEQAAEQARREAAAARDAEQRAMAERREAAARKKAEEQRHEAKGEATHRGRTVGEAMREGKIGYRDARNYESPVQGKQDTPPRELYDIANRLATDIAHLLDEDRDAERVRRLNLVMLFREDLDGFKREDLARALDGLAQRATAFAAGLRERTAPLAALR